MADRSRTVVLGGGVGGLSVAHFLSVTGDHEITVLEREPVLGGMCGSFEHDGFTLDYGAHKIYSLQPGVLDAIRVLMGERLIELPKSNRLFLRGRLVDYPLKLGNLARALGLGTFLGLGFGYAATAARGLVVKGVPRSYEEFMIGRFGRPAYGLVFEPLADKVWGDPATLHPDMARVRVPASGGAEVILKLLGLKKETAETSAPYFYYPRRGYRDFPQALAESVETSGGRVLTGAEVRDVALEGGRATAVTARIGGAEERFEADLVVSAVPVPTLARVLLGDSDAGLSEALSALEFRHVVLVYLFVERDSVFEDQWVFFPERGYLFSRIFEQKRMNPELGPEGRTAICCDFTCSGDSREWAASDEELVERCTTDLAATGLVGAEEVSGGLVRRVEDFYPRYGVDYERPLAAVLSRMREVPNLLLTGRVGMYNYNNADHCFDMGRFIAERLSAGDEPPRVMEDLERRVRDYRIVD